MSGRVGRSDAALDFSFLADKSFSIGNFVAYSTPVSCGVLHGSVLKPLLI